MAQCSRQSVIFIKERKGKESRLTIFFVHVCSRVCNMPPCHISLS
jgi:hypothetical protein